MEWQPGQGILQAGEFSTEKAVKKWKGFIWLFLRKMHRRIRKSIFRICALFRGTPYYEYADKTQLGNCIGKEYRASLAVTEEHLAGAIIKRLMEMEQLNNGGN